MGRMDSQWASFCQFGCYCKPIPCDRSTDYSGGDIKKIRDEIDTNIKTIRIVKNSVAVKGNIQAYYLASDTIRIDLSDAPPGTVEWFTEKLKETGE